LVTSFHFPHDNENSLSNIGSGDMVLCIDAMELGSKATFLIIENIVRPMNGKGETVQ